ncbi:hypothetical protein F5Y06DRAFT_267461 [Hypoxylon sp. FL0890]|nr:hypothetical protein F5Y06DRAFT_267461 [Hypoxylon sp. FL0890]
MHSIHSLLVLATGMMLSGSTTGNGSPVSRDELVTHTFHPESGFSGTLTLHPDQTLEYFKNEIGLDIDKLGRHSEIFPTSSSGNYTFPEGSGVEGTLSWDVAGRNSSPLTAYQRMACFDCEVVCSLWAIPFAFIACAVCISQHSCG